MPPAGFERAIPARERWQTHALDIVATGDRRRNVSELEIEQLICCSVGVLTVQPA